MINGNTLFHFLHLLYKNEPQNISQKTFEIFMMEMSMNFFILWKEFSINLILYNNYLKKD